MLSPRKDEDRTSRAPLNSKTSNLLKQSDITRTDKFCNTTRILREANPATNIRGTILPSPRVVGG